MMKNDRPVRLVAVLVLGLLLPAPDRGQHSRNLQPQDSVPAPLSGSGDYYALVIGINRYPSPLPSLQTAVNDATAIRDVLVRNYDFKDGNVTLLTDAKATRKSILDTINNYADRLSEQDNLLVYYAGHGYSDPATRRAYWIPADADSINSSNRIIADDLTSAIANQKALHVLVISDSCYSGGLTRAIDVPTASAGRMLYISRMMSRKSRTVLASGGDEPVADYGTDGHSVFAYAVLHSLQHPEQPIFTAADLFASVRHEVENKSNQDPQYAFIRNSNDALGDFVFMQKGVHLPETTPVAGEVSPVAPPPVPEDADMNQIRTLLTRYADAVNRRDTRQLKIVWPDVPGNRLEQIRTLPKGARIQISVASASLLDTNENAVVRCQQILDQDGKTRNDYVTFYVGRFNGGWIINQIPHSN